MEHIFKVIKKNSKNALKSNWISAIAIVLVFCGINLLFSILDIVLFTLFDIPGFIDVLSSPGYYLDDKINVAFMAVMCSFAVLVTYFFVMTPLILGITNWFYSLTSGKALDISSVFIFFDSKKLLFKAWLLYLNIFLRMCFWVVVYFTFVASFDYAIAYLYQYVNGGFGLALYSVASFTSVILYFAAFTAMVITYSKYFLAQFLIIENKHISVKNAIQLSIRITKGRRQEIFNFRLSFIGWLIINIFLAPILYTMPYYITASSLYGRVMISKWKMAHPEDIIFGENVNAQEDVPEYWEIEG